LQNQIVSPLLWRRQEQTNAWAVAQRVRRAIPRHVAPSNWHRDASQDFGVMPRWSWPITAPLALIVSMTFLGASPTAIAKTYRWSCLFGLRAAPAGLFWDNFRLEFTYDDVVGKAAMIGDQGIADVDIHRGPFGVTFLEKLVSGVAQTTTRC
jgi:hypothetical protein